MSQNGTNIAGTSPWFPGNKLNKHQKPPGSRGCSPKPAGGWVKLDPSFHQAAADAGNAGNAGNGAEGNAAPAAPPPKVKEESRILWGTMEVALHRQGQISTACLAKLELNCDL